jgi:hypothetical protein
MRRSPGSRCPPPQPPAPPHAGRQPEPASAHRLPEAAWMPAPAAGAPARRRGGRRWRGRLRQGRTNHEDQSLHRRVARRDLKRDLPVLWQRRGRLQADLAGLGPDFHIAVAGLLDHRPRNDNGPEKLLELVRQLFERCLPGGFRGCRRRHGRCRAGAGSSRSRRGGRSGGRDWASHRGPVIGDQSFCAGHHGENSFAARLRTSDAASELGERIRRGV